MIPLRDHNPSGRLAIITYFLISINVIVFGATFLLPSDLLEEFFQQYALIPVQIIQGQNLYTLFTSMFLHGGFGHIIGNMLFLNIFGDNLEDRLGHFKYLIYYLFCGLGASVLQILVNPFSPVPNLGASGAIAGVMGGYLVLFPRHRIDILFSLGWAVRQATVPAYFMLFYWLVIQFFAGVGSLAFMDQSMGGVAYFAHLGGFAAGWLLIKIFRS